MVATGKPLSVPRSRRGLRRWVAGWMAAAAISFELVNGPRGGRAQLTPVPYVRTLHASADTGPWDPGELVTGPRPGVVVRDRLPDDGIPFGHNQAVVSAN